MTHATEISGKFDWKVENEPSAPNAISMTQISRYAARPSGIVMMLAISLLKVYLFIVPLFVVTRFS